MNKDKKESVCNKNGSVELNYHSDIFCKWKPISLLLLWLLAFALSTGQTLQSFCFRVYCFCMEVRICMKGISKEQKRYSL